MIRYWVVRMTCELEDDDDLKDWEIPQKCNFDSVDWEIALKNNFVGIGWSYLGCDLTRFSERNKDILIEKLKKLSPERSSKNRVTSANSILRFVHEINVEDIIILPTYAEKGIIYFIGKVKSHARYLEKVRDKAYARTRRDVEWIKNVPRNNFSEPLKNSLNGQLTVFNIDDHGEEIKGKLKLGR